MFEPTSRYYALENATFTESDGNVIVYKRRRMLPKGENTALLAKVTVERCERLDQIAARTLGSAEEFWRMCDANNTMDPLDVVVIGQVLRVPAPQR